MPTLTMPKMPSFSALSNLSKFDAEDLFNKADALQTKALIAAEKVTAPVARRFSEAALPMANRLPAITTLHAEFFNRATKVQSANRVFVKRVFLGEVTKLAATKASTTKASATKVPATKVPAQPATRPAAKSAAKAAKK